MITVQAENGTFSCYENDMIIKIIKDYGVFHRSELAMIQSFLREGDTVIDVGAHIGTFCVPFKKYVGPKGKFLAFEANPTTYQLLVKNIQDNHLEITAFNKGISEDQRKLYVHGRDIDKRTSGSSLANVNSGTDYLSSEPSHQAQSDMVDLVRLDDLGLDRVDFIKVDVEGMEISVIKSALGLIHKHKPIIYCEYVERYIRRAGGNPTDLKCLLRKAGYDFFINVMAGDLSSKDFKLVRVPGPEYTVGQVDFLLCSRDSVRYPKNYVSWIYFKPHVFLVNRLKNFLKKYLGPHR
jgi:FkbM family methyltransferase